MGHSIRLLDAPLHEFFPHNSGLKSFGNANRRGVRVLPAQQRPETGREPDARSSLGPYGITNPEIPEMQIKAVLDAAAELISFLRDDADRFLPLYVDKEFFERHPFISIHPAVEKMVRTFVADARAIDPKFEIFICGEHGGDVYTIGRLHEIGLTGVSMSPGKVYRSIIKAAQCQVQNPRKSVK